MSERMQDKSMPHWVKAIAIGVWFIPLFITWIKPDLMDFPTWASMTLSGIAMGCLIFLMAVGLTIIFGLMDVLNFAHGVFFTIGAFIGWKLFNTLLLEWVESDGFLLNIAAITLAIIVASLVNILLGILMERIIIRKTYGDHLKQILVTMGVGIIVVELIRIIGSAEVETFIIPGWFTEAFFIGEVMVIRYQLFSILMGLLFFVLIQWFLNSTKIGLIVRAGVENPQMIKAMGYNLNKVFTGIFAMGAVLAGIGGLIWAGFEENVDAAMGDHNLIYAFVVVIIAGLGSVKGSIIGAIMVGIFFNYVAFFVPQLAAGSLIILMCIILMLKPSGLFPQK
ncbi:branched-chain amino acid ABC transporter permease [bacterium]|nr:branched-chain amino acid ABC transporter permease [bacterium]